MRHKGERHIPDFSRKPKPQHAVTPERQAAAPPPPSRTAQPKPPSTSSKSGRRGAWTFQSG